MGEIPSMRIVTLGKTGSGKSSLVNTLFGEKIFKVSPSANSETTFCASETKVINGTNVQLVDTPGFFDTDQKRTDEKDELLKCIIKCAPGPHAFFLVLKVEKFTSQEQAIVDLMIEYFTEEALKFTTVVFTHGDQLPEEQSIQEWVKENKALNELVQKCGGRCHVVDNKYWKKTTDEYSRNQHHIDQLLETIYKTIKENEGRCYTNDLLQKVQLMKEKEKVLIKQSSPNVTEELLEEQANESLLKKLKKNWIGVTVGALVGALLGGIAVGALAHVLGAPLLVKGAAAGVAGVVGGSLGGVMGGLVSEYHESVTKAMTHRAKTLLAHVTNPSKSDAEEFVKLMKSL